MTQWFRWHNGTSEDAKFRVVSRNARVTVRDALAVWAFMLEDASNDKHRGICERDHKFIAAVLDFEGPEVDLILQEMEDLEMIVERPEGIEILNWHKRQYEKDLKDPTGASRQRRWREKKKTAGETPRNGRETVAGHTETEAEAETETEKNEDSSADEKAKVYAFESGVIRLAQKDLDQWKRAYSTIAVEAELLALTEWAGKQGKRWFPAVSTLLARKNREEIARREAAKQPPKIFWASGIEGVPQ